MQTVQSTVSGTAAKTYEVDFLGLLYYKQNACSQGHFKPVTGLSQQRV
jgi:hypothetical protein